MLYLYLIRDFNIYIYIGFGEGIILDASIEKGHGIVANALLQWGSLNVGDSGNRYICDK